jgi:hypothetical protein
MEFVLIAAVIVYLIPGFVLLARRPEGSNLGGEAALTTLLWPLFIGTTRSKRKRSGRMNAD